MPMPMLAELGLNSLMNCVVVMFVLGIVFIIARALSSQDVEAVSHWYQLVDGLQYSTESFYEELRNEVDLWKIPNATVLQVEHPEGDPLFSAKRLYFRVQRNELIFDICGAKFGRGFFVSWWLI